MNDIKAWLRVSNITGEVTGVFLPGVDVELRSEHLIPLVKQPGQETDLSTVTILPDGSAFAMASYPPPKTHWLYAEGYNVPPMPLRMGTDNPERKAMNQKVWAAAKYAVRSATMNGKEPDFDPDALCQNMVVGLLGYHTANGLSSDSWANPDDPNEPGIL